MQHHQFRLPNCRVSFFFFLRIGLNAMLFHDRKSLLRPQTSLQTSIEHEGNFYYLLVVCFFFGVVLHACVEVLGSDIGFSVWRKVCLRWDSLGELDHLAFWPSCDFGTRSFVESLWTPASATRLSWNGVRHWWCCADFDVHRRFSRYW